MFMPKSVEKLNRATVT